MSDLQPSVCPVAETIHFSQMCMLFEKLQKAKNNQVRINEFNLFVKRWNDLQTGLSTFYPAFRLILPQLDKERAAYGVKETLLAKLYIDILGLSSTGQDAKKLLKFRHVKQSSTSSGDFAEVAFHHVLSKRCINKGKCTIANINMTLDEISTHNSNKKKDLMKKSLLHLIQKTSALEQKWLIRIMLKDMKLHLGQKTFLKEFHPDAEDLYNVTTNLRMVCEKLKDPSVRLSDTEISMFHPFRPMLAAMIRIDEVENVFGGKQFQMEIKYDGERSQIHKNAEQYKFFSRSGKEYSSVFGETCYQGTLSKYIHKCFASHVKSCIVDGEMMAYNPKHGIFMQKGGKFDIKHVTEDSDFQPCFVAFDILYLNGENIASKKQHERFQMLENAISPTEGRIVIAEKKYGKTNKEIVEYLNDAIDRREEGIVIKDLGSAYSPNKRKESGWYKVKPEYVSGVADDLDLVIIGGSFGVGKRANFLSMFHLAVSVGDDDAKRCSNSPEKFKTFCRIGSGYTDQELLQIVEKLKPHLKVFDKKNPPNWLEVGKDKPEVTIHPKYSLVVQVRASEIIPSNSYATQCTLRFPRLIAVREDKLYPDALSFNQLNELQHAADGKLAQSHATLGNQQPAQKRRKTVNTNAVTSVPARYQGIDVSSVSKVTTSFNGKVFCIVLGASDNTKQVLEKRIIEHGGLVVQNPTADVWCIIAKDEKNIKVRNIIKSKKYNVAKVSWLLRCFESGSLVSLKPTELLFATTDTEEHMKEIYDKFGDDFTQDVDENSLRKTFSRIEAKYVESVLPDINSMHRNAAIQTFVNNTFQRFSVGFHDLSSHLFCGFNFFIPCKNICNPMETGINAELQNLVKFFGGIINDSLMAKNTSHVIMDECLINDQLQQKVNEENLKRVKKFHVVTKLWLFDCISKKCTVAEAPYHPSIHQ